jgi:hypothetical protein
MSGNSGTGREGLPNLGTAPKYVLPGNEIILFFSFSTMGSGGTLLLVVISVSFILSRSRPKVRSRVWLQTKPFRRINAHIIIMFDDSSQFTSASSSYELPVVSDTIQHGNPNITET